MSKQNCSLCRFWQSSIGKKVVVAVTGAVLAGFLAGHLIGNMLAYVGPHAFNEYAEFLHTMVHGAGVWIARIFLLSCLVLHIAATVGVVKANRAAKDGGYVRPATMRASRSSQIMIWSGLTILAFIIFHILHYTVRIDAGLDKLASQGKAYEMMVLGFQNTAVSIFYIIAITLLCSHLSHGVASIFQTLGLRTKKTAKAIDIVAKVYSFVIWAGFISVPIAVMTGILK